MADPADLIHELLPQMRAERAAFRTEIERRFDLIERRFDALESDMVEVKRTLRGLTYMTATFVGRLEEVESRVDRFSPR